MVKLKQLFEKYKIKTEENFPKGILEIEIDNDANQFNKGYKHNGQIIFNGEYEQKDTEYNRKFNIKIIINSLDNIDQEILTKLEEYNKTRKQSIWENKEEAIKGLELLDFECVEYYVASQDIPTTFITYNVLGGIIRHS